MAEHDAPVSWFQRWRDAEPVRLYLYSMATAVVAAALVAGWVTAELAVAVTGVAAAVLMLPAIVAARHDAYSARTVDHLLDAQHADSYQWGVRDGLQSAGQRSPEQVAVEQGALPTEQIPGSQCPVCRTFVPRVLMEDHLGSHGRRTDRTPAETVALRAQMQRPLRRACPNMDEHGARCTLTEHPRAIPHRLEADWPGE